MRDPDRIDRMHSKLRALWHAHPDQRLGQLVVNLTPPHLPTFHVEDDVMETRIERITTRGFGDHGDK